MTEVDEFRDQLARQLEDNRALRSRYALIADRELSRSLKTAERLFKRYGETGALPRLAAWKLRGISAEEVLTDGLFPIAGTTTFGREPD